MNIYIKVLTAGCGAIAVTAAVLIVAQGDPATSAQSTNATQAINATQGMVAVIDKESGELRVPTTDEARRYQVSVQRSDSPLPVERRADGSESMKLDDRFTTYSTVERRADGSWSRQCSLKHDHAQHAHKAVQ